VVGAGAWGTALAQVAARGGPVTLWAREADTVADINERRENRTFLPGIRLDRGILATPDLGALSDCAALMMVTPAQHLRAVLQQIGAWDGPLILCCKGIEAGTKKLMSEVAADVLPDACICVLSGPTFADEVAQGLPAAVTFACENEAAAGPLTQRIASGAFRPYYSDDVTGAEIGGAVKNVLAIACGVAAGLRLGKNARAALISRGFAEMTRFGLARGARAETLAGLSGLGDLVLTCSSEASRNMAFGKALGEGRGAAELMADRVTVAEGVFTAPVLVEAAQDLGIDMPISETVLALIEGRMDAAGAREALMARPLKEERP
jgi:glycerol-3-phosphate dehydrogenase (NAD(P)+)